MAQRRPKQALEGLGQVLALPLVAVDESAILFWVLVSPYRILEWQNCLSCLPHRILKEIKWDKEFWKLNCWDPVCPQKKNLWAPRAGRFVLLYNIATGPFRLPGLGLPHWFSPTVSPIYGQSIKILYNYIITLLLLLLLWYHCVGRTTEIQIPRLLT